MFKFLKQFLAAPKKHTAVTLDVRAMRAAIDALVADGEHPTQDHVNDLNAAKAAVLAQYHLGVARLK